MKSRHFAVQSLKARQMTSWPKTAPVATALLAGDQIISLARDVLSSDSYEEAEEVAELLTHRGERRRLGIARMVGRLAPFARVQTRPLFYLAMHLKRLPHHTRDSLRYAGDYVDLLAKEWTSDYVGQVARRRSLTSNSKTLQVKAKDFQPLPEMLRRFADFLYTPAKHDFRIPKGQSHRFTSREAVLAVYVSIELGARILKVSSQARKAAKADNWYILTQGRWGSGTRVHYVGD